MKKALIIGATGTIGSAVNQKFINAGYKTTIVSRSTPFKLNIDNAESVTEFFNINNFYDAIICTAGQANFGKLENLEEEDFQISFNSKLMGQIRIVQNGIKRLNPNGAIILTGGMLAYDPWPETSLVVTINAGLEGFVKAISKEIDSNKKIYIVHPPLVAETAKYMGLDETPWPNAESVASLYLNTIEHKSENKIIFLNGYEPKNTNLPV